MFHYHYDIVTIADIEEGLILESAANEPVRVWNDYSQGIEEIGRFCVSYSLPGCSPKHPPQYFDTLEEAEECVRSLRLDGEARYGRNDPYRYEILDGAAL